MIVAVRATYTLQKPPSVALRIRERSVHNDTEHEDTNQNTLSGYYYDGNLAPHHENLSVYVGDQVLDTHLAPRHEKEASDADYYAKESMYGDTLTHRRGHVCSDEGMHLEEASEDGHNYATENIYKNTLTDNDTAGDHPYGMFIDHHASDVSTCTQLPDTSKHTHRPA